MLLYAITQGAIPSLDLLPSLPAFDLAFWADHPRFALFTITAGGVKDYFGDEMYDELKQGSGKNAIASTMPTQTIAPAMCTNSRD